ncbi:hypothetical protein VTO73DRAFT_7683 [Trametes versicolor]
MRPTSRKFTLQLRSPYSIPGTASSHGSMKTCTQKARHSRSRSGSTPKASATLVQLPCSPALSSALHGLGRQRTILVVDQGSGSW